MVSASGDAVVRAGERDGVASVWRIGATSRERVFRTGAELAGLGRFPMLADDGAVGVAVERRGLGWTYAVSRGGAVSDALGAGSVAFVRGGLLVGGGVLAVYATPHGRPPCVLVGPDVERDVLFALGGAFSGAEITDYALNPVSGANSGWVAVRLSLADGRQVIARTASPVAPW